MKILWFCVLVFVHNVFAGSEHGFGNSYLKNSRLCHQWKCLNAKLCLPESLPPKSQFTTVLRSLLPQGSWQNVVDEVLNVCYGDKPRRYTNTCPGQALMHCAVDQLIQYCPDVSSRKADVCAPLTSLAGFKYMFSQSRYENLEKNLPKERRPEWFLRNYFSSKCCNLPVLLNSTVLSECGFSSVIQYQSHEPKAGQDNVEITKLPKNAAVRDRVEKVQVVELDENSIDNTPNKKDVDSKIVALELAKSRRTGDEDNNIDPLDCCDLTGFIEQSWRSECGFQLTWDNKNRLSISNSSQDQAPTTVTPMTKPVKMRDVKIVPQSCEKETCVFRKLNIITETGGVDLDAFSKLLDNVTDVHTSWTKAKARVVTKCLSKPITDYKDDCKINKVLACTFDVLTENCPYAKKHDPCKHTNILKNDITCQISSSKFRPKNRRQFCGFPNLVNHEVLMECGLNSLSRMEYVPDPATTRPKTHWWTKSNYACKGSTDSTKCLLGKMGVLNKYGFLDYFKMKDEIRSFTSQETIWSVLTDVYLNTFTSMPLYGDQCSTPKKLLNVVDTMLITCPVSKRKHTLQCNRLLTNMANTAPPNQKLVRDKITQAWSHYKLIFSDGNAPYHVGPKTTTKKPVIHKNPPYDFGILSSKDAPPVQIIDVKPTRKPLVLLPVYLRMNGKGTGNLSVRPYSDGILRGDPFAMPGNVATMA